MKSRKSGRKGAVTQQGVRVCDISADLEQLDLSLLENGRWRSELMWSRVVLVTVSTRPLRPSFPRGGLALERDRALFDLAPRPKQPGFGRHLLAEHPYNRLWATVNDGQQDAGGANRRRVARWELANTRHTPRRGRTTTPRPTPTGQPALDRYLYICKCQ